MNVPLADWLSILRNDYLREFIRHGGAAVKFAVPVDDESHRDCVPGLNEMSKTTGFVFATVDAAKTRSHMVDHIFFELARQIDWTELTRAFLCRLLSQHGYKIPADGDLSCRDLARLHGREEFLLRNEVHSWLEKAIYRDYAMTQEYRLAMIRLCMGELDSGATPFLVTSVREWLRGELRLISALKQALIFQKITRKNARHMIASLTHWLRSCGKEGLVVVMDISRYTVSKPLSAKADERLYYSISAVLDGHEVLRQFIDGTDELEGCLIVVLAAREFLTDYRRGINCYDALRLRIADEVHDKARANPFASLVQLTGAA